MSTTQFYYNYFIHLYNGSTAISRKATERVFAPNGASCLISAPDGAEIKRVCALDKFGAPCQLSSPAVRDKKLTAKLGLL